MLDAVALVEMALSNWAGVKVGTTDPSPSRHGSNSSSDPSRLMSVHRRTCPQQQSLNHLLCYSTAPLAAVHLKFELQGGGPGGTDDGNPKP